MISKDAFVKFREMLSEASNKHGRANALLEKEDYSGAVEASQHCVELAIKSLFILFGLDPPYTHDPGKELDKIVRALEEAGSETNNDSTRALNTFVFSRMKWLSSLMGRLHTEGMYGYNGTQSSIVFRERDAEYFNGLSAEILFTTFIFLMAVGTNLGFVSEEEKKGLEELSNLLRFLQLFQD